MDNIKDRDQLIVGRKAVSVICAGFILTSTMVFVAGYFWGYRRASKDVAGVINKNSFADQISYAANHNFNTQGMSTDQTDQVDQVVVDVIVPNTQNIIATEAEVVESIANNNDITNDINVDTSDVSASAKEAIKYYAELIGFGRLKPAQSFVDKLKQKGYATFIRKRVSKSGGKVVNWYQVITAEFTSKDQLQQLLNGIKKTERLQNIKIKKA
jgi:hypothetical protein